ncbi:MAG: SIMPL domain-containing protein [Bacteroidota bacterium]|nr:SIMPL domain-containing protein [Bacteroidota bacterium]
MKKLLFAGLAMLTFACQRPEVERVEPRGMMIRSSGKVEVPPDMASFSISMNCLKGSVKGARECLLEEMDEIFSFLKEQGVNDQDLMTSYLDVRRQYKWTRNGNVFIGYQASTSLRVIVRDLEKLNNIYGKFLENEERSIVGLNFSHSKMDSLQAEAYSNALNNARVVAEKLLPELGGGELEVVQVGNVELERMADEPRTKRSSNYLMEEEDNMYRPVAEVKQGLVNAQVQLFVEFRVNPD